MKNKNACQTIRRVRQLTFLLKNKNKYNGNVVETNNFLVCIWKVILDLQQPVIRVKITQNIHNSEAYDSFCSKTMIRKLRNSPRQPQSSFVEMMKTHSVSSEPKRCHMYKQIQSGKNQNSSVLRIVRWIISQDTNHQITTFFYG